MSPHDNTAEIQEATERKEKEGWNGRNEEGVLTAAAVLRVIDLIGRSGRVAHGGRVARNGGNHTPPKVGAEMYRLCVCDLWEQKVDEG